MSQVTLTQINNGDTPDASILMANLNALKNRINLGMESDNLASGSVNGSHINLGAYIFKESKGADVASAGSMTLGNDGNFFDITGTTTITSITAKTAGTCVKLQFDGILTVTDGSNLKLNGDFITAAESTLTLVSDGTNWYEISRSPVLPAVGTSGNVLTSNGTVWASATPDLRLVQSGTPSAVSSFTISSLVAGSRYRLALLMTQNTSDGYYHFRFNSDTGANYYYGGVGPANGVGPSGQTFIALSNYNGTPLPVIATYKWFGTYDFMFDPASNNNIWTVGTGIFKLNASFQYPVIIGGYYTGSTTVSTMTVTTSAGTMTGAWYLYKLA